MIRRIRGLAGKSALAVAVAVLSVNGHAMLSQNVSVDLRALSLGNAVTADPPGIDSIPFNPAGLSKINGTQLDVQLLMAGFAISSDFSAPAGFNVFGYSDDPVVCTDRENDGQRLCSNFTTAHSEAAGGRSYRRNPR